MCVKFLYIYMDYISKKIKIFCFYGMYIICGLGNYMRKFKKRVYRKGKGFKD